MACIYCGKTGLSMAVVCGFCGELAGEPQKLKGEPSKWSLENNRAIYRNNGVTEVYDEAELRLCISRYLSNESRARFADDGRFSNNQMFFDGLKHLMVGLELFFPLTATPPSSKTTLCPNNH